MFEEGGGGGPGPSLFTIFHSKLYYSIVTSLWETLICVFYAMVRATTIIIIIIMGFGC